MKVAIAVLVVLAAVLGAQANPADNFAVAVVETAVKGIANVPRCLGELPGALITELSNLAQACFSSVESIPICLVGGAQQLLGDIFLEFSNCLSA